MSAQGRQLTHKRRTNLQDSLARLSVRRSSEAAMPEAFQAYNKHAMFVVRPPNGRIVKAYVDTILLLSTFMFAFAAGNISNIERDDLFRADDEWSKYCAKLANASTSEPTLPGLCDAFTLPSVRLAGLVTASYVVLGSSVLVSILCYMAILFSEIDESTRASSLHLWWRIYQWPMHLAMLLLAVGIVLYGLTMETSARIMFINLTRREWVEQMVWGEITSFNVVFVVVAAVVIYMVGGHVISSMTRKQRILLQSVKEHFTGDQTCSGEDATKEALAADEKVDREKIIDDNVE